MAGVGKETKRYGVNRLARILNGQHSFRPDGVKQVPPISVSLSCEWWGGKEESRSLQRQTYLTSPLHLASTALFQPDERPFIYHRLFESINPFATQGTSVFRVFFPPPALLAFLLLFLFPLFFIILFAIILLT